MNRLIFFSIIFLIVGISCNRPKEKPSLVVQELRDLYDSYLYYYQDSLQWVSNHNKLKTELYHNEEHAYKEAIDIAHEVFWRKDNNVRIAFLDSLIKTDEFQQYHRYNKFTAYFANSRLNSQAGNTKSAVDNAIKADQILENDWELYELEKNKVRSLMFESILQFSMIEKPIVEMNVAYADTLLKYQEKPNLDVIRTMAKIFLSYYYLKDYGNSQVWANKLLNLDYDLRGLSFYSDIMFIKCENFKNLNQIDSIKMMSRKMEKEFREGLISEKIYRYYQAWNLSNDALVTEPEYVLKVSDTLMNFITDDCKNNYIRLILTNNRRKVAKLLPGYEKDLKKEVFASLKQTRTCDEENTDFWEEELEIISQVMSDYEATGNNIEYFELMDRKSYLEQSLNNMTQSFLDLNNYLAGLETTNQKLKSEYELKKAQKTKVIFYMILALLSISVIGLSYLLLLYRKNTVYKKEILLKNNQLDKAKNEVRKKNNHLKDIKNKLEERNVLLKNFAFQAAKDIKSPILVIQENLEQISKHYNSVFHKENREMVHYLNLSVRQLATMIETLLEYSTKEKNIDKNELVDVSEKLKRVCANLGNQIRIKQATVTIPEDLPMVMANNTLVEKLFQNLIANALKYSKENESPKIEISYKIIDNNRVQFVIKDEGIGIAEEHQKDIFQIFYKLDNDNKFEGSGIGLSICKKIVLEFEGKIWVDSEVDKGSNFYFTLPYLDNSINQKHNMEPSLIPE